MKKWWKSKTLWLGFGLELLGAIKLYSEYLVLFMSQKMFGGLMLFIGIAVMVLRFISDKKLIK